MDKTLKRVFFWMSFLIGCFFIWWSDRALNASSAMVAFATGAIFLIVACVVALTSDIFFKYHNNNQEDASSVPASVPVLLLTHDKVTEDGVPLSHRDMSTGGGSLFVLESANLKTLEEVFVDADLDGARLDAAISTWNELPISRTGKGV